MRTEMWTESCEQPISLAIQNGLTQEASRDKELAFHHATIGVGVGTVSTVIEAPITFDWTSILNWWTQVAVRVFGAFIVIVVDVAKDVRSPDHRSNR